MSKIDSKKNRKLYFEEVAESLVKNGFYKTKEEALKSVKETALEKKQNGVLVSTIK